MGGLTIQQAKDIEMEFRDALISIFEETKKVLSWNYVSTQRVTNKSDGHHPRYNYERDYAMYENKYDIYFNGDRIASTRNKPHKHITVYAFFDENHYIQKMFERVAYTHLPNVKLETVNHE